MRRRLVLTLVLFMSAFCAFAQSMSDDQVISYVLDQQKKGASQVTIVTSLMKKGVTAEQLRRVRKKYQAEQTQLGAQDLTGTTTDKGASRLRTDKQIAEDKKQEKQNYMVTSERQAKEQLYLPSSVRQDELNNEIGFLDIDSLAHYQELLRKQTENDVFGRNIFSNKNLSFQPNMNMATPQNYRLGAGDKVLIDVWGASQANFEQTISPDGTIVLDKVGVVKLAGLSVKQATEKIKKSLSRFYADCNYNLSVGDIRSITVQVMGEVNIPGTYTVSSLSSAFNALYMAGGINNVGTLRNIKVYRSGRVVSVIDVYDMLLNGNTSGDIRLSDGDVIVVGPYDGLVCMRGKVKRPMYYEVKSHESLQQIIKYAGGFTGDAYTKNVRVTRRAGEEWSIHTIGEFDMSSFSMKDADSVYVDSVVAKFSNMVEVRGSVKHPGQYQLGRDIQTVKDLLEAADGLSEDAYKTRAVMHRLKDDETLEMVSIDLENILKGRAADVPLKKNDVLFIPSTITMQGEQTLRVTGEVTYPGTYQYADKTTLSDIILQAGGFTSAASTANVQVFRRIRDGKANKKQLETAQVFSFSLDENLKPLNDTVFFLLPFDQIVVRKSPVYGEQKNIKVLGCVNFEGDYAMTNLNYRLSDLVNAAGGLSDLAYAKGARLNRKMTKEEKEQREKALRAAQIQLYEEAQTTDNKNFNMAEADSLLNLKLNLGDVYPVAINLEEALKSPGCNDDVLLRENDELIIPQYSNTVKISGEVMYPISMNYENEKSLRYYIDHAGGFGNKASKKRVYAIYMNGSVQKLGKRSTKKKIEPGCEIVVPSKTIGKKMSTAEIMSLGTSSASVAAVIATMINALK